MTPNPAVVRQIVAEALLEDIGPGDITTSLCVPPERCGVGTFLAKQDGVLSGLYVVAECFRQAAPDCTLEQLVAEAESFAAGDVLARVTGPCAQTLTAERVALNFLQRLSGIATLTAQYVRAVAATQARILDTRKTTPGLRVLEKAAVRAGGGHNHRFALYDGVLIKDNHIAAAGGIRAVLNAARARVSHMMKVEIEVDTLTQLAEVLAVGGADVVLLDNMDTPTLRQAVALVAGRLVTEASGNMALPRIAEVAATGVDYISCGALTHSARTLDLGLDF